MKRRPSANCLFEFVNSAVGICGVEKVCSMRAGCPVREGK
jgi:hypothetical protein